MRYTGHATRIGQMKNVCLYLEGKSEGKILQARSRHVWEENTEIDTIIGTEWIHLAPDADQGQAFVHNVMKHRVP
jgi:hypothetical protein